MPGYRLGLCIRGGGEALRGRVADRLLPWLPFCLLFLWGWRTPDIVHSVPGMADVLEVLWGVQWYRDCLFSRGVSPLYCELIAHPHGWHTAALAHTPFIFLLMLPLNEFAGPAFAYNVSVILSLGVAFAGALRFAGQFTGSRFGATLVGLVFTFVGMRWFRTTQGHLNILWLSALVPWLLWALERARLGKSQIAVRRWLRFAGVIWGVMICSSLYGVFLGGLCFLIWGREIFRWKRIRQAGSTALVALGVGLPVILLHWDATCENGVIPLGLEHVLHWGASVNSLIAPNVHHPISAVRDVARGVYSGPYDESGVSNLGLVTCIFGALGLWRVIRRKGQSSNLAWLAVAGVVLSCGLLLKWDGDVVWHPVFWRVNNAVWGVGRFLKPSLFTSAEPQPPFGEGLPLPGFLLAAIVPFWESGRVMSRYALVGGLGLMVLAVREVQALPRIARYVVALLWLVETLPVPTSVVPVPLTPHPAYTWVSQQDKDGTWGIVDVACPTLMVDPRVLYGTCLHGVPTVSGGRPFLPRRVRALWRFLARDPKALACPKAGLVLRCYDVRYLFLHVIGDEERSMWSLVVRNPAFDPVGCFEPLEEPSPWSYPICVAEVSYAYWPANVTHGGDLVLLGGWSEQEDWGIWAEGTESSARWIAPDKVAYRLCVEAFPLHVPGRCQQVSIEINGQQLAAYRWSKCETWSADLEVPPSLVEQGWNDMVLRYEYAARPSELPDAKTEDARQLSVGFVRLEVRRDDGC